MADLTIPDPIGSARDPRPDARGPGPKSAREELDLRVRTLDQKIAGQRRTAAYCRQEADQADEQAAHFTSIRDEYRAILDTLAQAG